MCCLPLSLSAQTPGGSVTVSSTPAGAEVKLEGDATVAGVTPTTFRQVLIGNYEVIVSKRGYETYKTKITLDPTRHTSLAVTLSPKTNIKAAFRSMIIPGWGQHYGERKTKGILMHVLAAGSIAAYFIADHNFDIKYERFERKRQVYDNAVAAGAGYEELQVLLADLNEAQQEALDKEDIRRISIGTVIGAWGISVLDALFFFPDDRGTFSVKGVDVGPEANLSTIGLQLSVRF